MRLLGSLISILVIDFGVDASLGLILDPLTDEKFIFGVIEVTTLAFALITHPVAFEMVTVTLGQYTVTIALALMPLAFKDVLVSIDHSAFALWQSIDPVAVVSVSILVKEGASAMLLVLVPVASVLTTQLAAALVLPVGTLAVALVDGPHALVLVTVLVELDAEAFFAVIAPVSDVLLGGLPLFTLDSAVLRAVLLLDPVDGAMGSIFLSLRVITKMQNTSVSKFQK